MTPDQIAQVARQAGFPESSIPIAVAVAMAESSGNPMAHNPRPPDDSYGLWQINMLGALGPERRAAFGLASNAELFDPLTNARAAYSISSGGSYWRPWSTYKDGSYKKYMQPSYTPTAQGSGDTSGGISAFLPPALFSPGGALSSFSNPPVWVTWAMWGAVAFIILMLLKDRMEEPERVYVD
jgi:hypothetical protein